MRKFCLLSILISVALLFFIGVIADADSFRNQIHTEIICQNAPLQASGVSVIKVLDLNQYQANGDFSIEVVIAGDGILKGEYALASVYNGINDSTAGPSRSGATDWSIDTPDIFTNHTDGSGVSIFALPPLSSGVTIAPYMAIIFTETGGANSISGITAYLNIR